MSDVTRWLTWTPKGKTGSPILEKTLEDGMPKVPKPISGTFGTVTPGLFQKIEQPATEPEPISGGPSTRPEMAQQVSRWLRSRCVRSSRAWGAEKFLYRDYLGWCGQSSQPAIPAKQFADIVTETFVRDADGWQGVCLAVDWDASKRSLTTGVIQ